MPDQDLIKFPTSFAVQLTSVKNIGVSIRDQNGMQDPHNSDGEDDEKIENKYLDPSLAVQGRQFNHANNRALKLEMTLDGYRGVKAFEYVKWNFGTPEVGSVFLIRAT